MNHPTTPAPSARRQYLQLADEHLSDASIPTGDNSTRQLAEIHALRSQAAALCAIGEGMDEIADRLGQIVDSLDAIDQRLRNKHIAKIELERELKSEVSE